MVSHSTPSPQPDRQTDQKRVVNDYKRFVREPDLLIKLPAEKQADESAKTREFQIPADAHEDGLE